MSPRARPARLCLTYKFESAKNVRLYAASVAMQMGSRESRTQAIMACSMAVYLPGSSS